MTGVYKNIYFQTMTVSISSLLFQLMHFTTI